MNRPVMSLAGQLSRRSPAMLSKASSSSSGAFAQPIFARSYATPSSSSPSSSSSTSTPAATTSPNVEGTAQSVVRWDRYLSLRKQKRLAGLVTTVPTTFLAAAGAGSYFLTQEVDPSQAIMGIDPVYVFALATIGCTGEAVCCPPCAFSFWGSSHLSWVHRLRVPHRADAGLDDLVDVPPARHEGF